MKNVLQAIFAIPAYPQKDIEALVEIIHILTRKGHVSLRQHNAYIEELKARGTYRIWMTTYDQIETVYREINHLDAIIRNEWKKLNESENITGDDLTVIFENMLSAYLPRPLLEKVSPYFQESIHTIRKITEQDDFSNIGTVRKDYCLRALLRAFKIATGETEMPKLSYLSNRNVKEVIAAIEPPSEIEMEALHKEISYAHMNPRDKIPDLTVLRHQAKEITFLYLINKNISQYKTVLHQHIKNELLQHPEIYVTYFNSLTIAKVILNKPADPIIDCLEDYSANTTVRQTLNAKPSLLKAMMNYKNISNAQNILTYNKNNVAFSAQLETPAGRLEALFRCYPKISDLLAPVNNIKVDESTSRIKRFFNRMWKKLNWLFSSLYNPEKRFLERTTRLVNHYSIFVNKKVKTKTASIRNESERIRVRNGL